MENMTAEFDMDKYKKDLSAKIERDRISRLAEHGISILPGKCTRCNTETIPELYLCGECIDELTRGDRTK